MATTATNPSTAGQLTQSADDSVPLKTWISVIGVLIGCFLAVLNIVVTNSSLRDIAGTLGASADEISWIPTSYLVAEIVVIPLTGWLSAAFSLKKYLMVNSILFVLFSICCGHPLRDRQGHIVRWYFLMTDIDDRKRAEDALRQTQGDLVRINRVTTMGELAASLAHEVNQPISGVLINANVCLRKLGRDNPDLDEARAAVTRIQRDAQRAADIIGKIRSQFEKAAPNREVLDVNDIIRETASLLRSEAVRYNISVRTELAADLPQIIGDRVQLQQVAMNLIVNSLEAMRDVAQASNSSADLPK